MGKWYSGGRADDDGRLLHCWFWRCWYWWVLWRKCSVALLIQGVLVMVGVIVQVVLVLLEAVIRGRAGVDGDGGAYGRL